MRILFVTGILLAALFMPHQGQAQTADPEDAKPCNEAEVMMLMGTNSKATDYLLACAQVPNQTPFKIAKSRFRRFQLLQDMEQMALAEAELVALTTPPLSEADVFSGTPSGAIIFGGKQSIGATQVALLGARASYRVFDKDLAAGVPLADRAIALAGHDPAFVFDVASAYAAKAKAAYLQQNTTEIVANSVRAYLRGIEDPWINDVIKQLPPETQAALQTQRASLREGAGAYAFAISPQAQTPDKIETAKRVVAEGAVAVKALEDFEHNQLGLP